MQFRGPAGVSLLSALLLSVSCSAWPFFDYYQQPALLPPSPPQHHSVRSFGPHEPQKPITLRGRADVLDNTIDTSSDSIIGHLSHLQAQLFSIPNNETGLKVASWHEGMGVNPEELGEYVEGDILYPNTIGRNGIRSESARWPHGIVPYIISPYFKEDQKRIIREAMADYRRYTCIEFKPYKGEESDYLRITAGDTGCWSSVGRVGGRQDLNLQVPNCVYQKGTVIHELMHAIGFLHEQSRAERDEYVSVLWRNVQRGREGNFEKSQKSTTDAFGIGYDYDSVMHYSAKAFSRNGQPTIMPKGRPVESIGQRVGFSIKDIQKIRRMYKCSKRKRNKWFVSF